MRTLSMLLCLAGASCALAQPADATPQSTPESAPPSSQAEAAAPLSLALDLPAVEAPCDPRPGGPTHVLVFAHGAALPKGVSPQFSHAAVFDTGLVLLAVPRGESFELRDPLGDLFGRPVGTLQPPRADGGNGAATAGRLALNAMSPHCPAVEGLARSLAPQDNRARRVQPLLASYLGALEAVLLAERNAEPDRARGLIEAAVAAREAALGERHVLTVRARTNRLFVARTGDRATLRRLADELPAALAALDPRSLASIEGRRVRVTMLQIVDGDDLSIPPLQSLYVEASRTLGDGHDLALMLTGQLAAAYASTGRNEEALALETRLLAHWSAVAGPDNRRSLEYARRVAHRTGTLGRKREAAEQLEALLPRARQALGPDDDLTQRIVSQLAWARMRLDDFDGALPLAQEFLDKRRARFAGNAVELASAKVRYAEALWGVRRRDEALVLLREALAARTAAYGPSDVETMDVRDQLARALFELRRFDQSAPLHAEQIERIEAGYAASVLATDQRVLDWSTWVPTYRRAAANAIELGDPQAAFRLVELAKGRQLLESVRARLARRAAVGPAERQRIEAIEAGIARLDEEVGRAPDATARIAIEARRQAATDALAAVNRELEQRFPDYRRLRAPTPVTADALARALPPRTLFVHLVVDEDDLVVMWLGAGQRLQAVRRARNEHLRAHLELLARLVQNPAATPLKRSPQGRFSLSGDGVDATEAQLLDAVSDEVLAPLRPALARARAIVFSADGALRRFPLEALRLDGRALVERWEVSYAPSGTIYLAAQELARANRAADRPRTLLAIGDVDFGAAPAAAMPAAVPGAGGAMARADRPADLAPVAASREVQRSVRSGDARFASLPGSRAEVLAVAALMGPAADTLLGPQATKQALLELDGSGALAGYRHVLLSTHGVLDLEYPALSAIVLGRPPGDGPGSSPDAGYVTAAEWMTLRFRTDLLVASACETALGGEGDGHGVGGLPLAFQLAGNPRTVLTLWRIDDASGSRFVQRLYRHLAAGRSPAAALRAAKLEFRADPRTARPYHWAPYVLFGATG